MASYACHMLVTGLQHQTTVLERVNGRALLAWAGVAHTLGTVRSILTSILQTLHKICLLFCIKSNAQW